MMATWDPREEEGTTGDKSEEFAESLS
jgi:hypothetical protein